MSDGMAKLEALTQTVGAMAEALETVGSKVTELSELMQLQQRINQSDQRGLETLVSATQSLQQAHLGLVDQLADMHETINARLTVLEDALR